MKEAPHQWDRVEVADGADARCRGGLGGRQVPEYHQEGGTPLE
jgi:hypothetical protein